MFLAHPALLALLPAAPLLAMLGRRAGRLGNAAAACKGMAAAALVIALAGPFVSVGRTGDVNDVNAVVLDLSPSTGGPLDEAVKRAIDAATSDAATKIVAVSNRAEIVRDARVLLDPASLTELRGRLVKPLWPDDPIGGGSALAAGLQLAGTLIGPSDTGRVTLVSDGRQTRGDAAAEASRLAARGIAVRTVATATSTSPNSPGVIVRSVDVPPATRSGQTGDIAVVIESAGIGNATVRLRLAGAETDSKVRLHAGVNDVHLQVPLSNAGPNLVDVSVSREGIAGQATAKAALNVGEAVRIGIVGGDGDMAAAALAGVMGESAVTRSLTTADLESADTLGRLDLVVLSDLPADRLSATAQRVLRAAVAERGLGMWVTGAARSFGPGGYGDSPLADLLPVRMAQPIKTEDPSTALVIVVDTSGSMKGRRIAIAKEIARLAVRRLQPHDKVGIVEFYGNKRWAAPLQSAGNASELNRALNRLDAGGGTLILPAIEEAVYGLRNVNTRTRHLLVLTDGGVEDGAFEPLIRRAAEDGITVSTVLCGPGENSPFLSALAEWGHGRAYVAADRFGLPEIILRQPQTSPLPPIVETPTNVVAGDDPLAALLPATLPPVRGFVRTTAKPTADVALRTAAGDVILSRWRCGLGSVVAVPTQLGSAWTGELGTNASFAGLLAAVVRETARPVSTPLIIAPQLRPAGLEIDLRTATPHAEPLPPAIDVELRDAASAVVRKVTAQPVSPGRWNVLMSGLPNGVYRIEAKAADGAMLGENAIAVPPPWEFASFQPDDALLKTIAGFTPAARTLAPRYVDLRPPAVVLAVVLLIAHVALRRWPARRRQAIPTTVRRAAVLMFVIGLVGIIASPAVAQSTTRPVTATTQPLRDALLARGDAGEFLAGLVKNASDAQALPLLADIAAEQGNVSRSIDVVRKMREADPRDAALVARLAGLYEINGDDGQAVSALHSAIDLETDPGRRDRLRVRLRLMNADNGRPAADGPATRPAAVALGDAVAAYVFGDFDAAGRTLNEFADASPTATDRTFALMLQGDCDLRQRRPADATRRFEAALASATEARERRYIVERVIAAHRAAGDLPQLADRWLADAALPTDQILPLATVLRDLGRTDDVLALWRRPLAGAASGTSSARLAAEALDAAATSGRPEAARDVCREMLARSSMSDQWMAALVRQCVDAGDAAEADRVLLDAEHAWADAGAWKRLATIAKNEGRYAVAVHIAENAATRGEHVEGPLLIADVERQQGRRDAGLAVLRNAGRAAQASADLKAVRAVAEAMEQAGGRGEAIDLLQWCAARSAGDDVSRRLAWLLEQAGRFPEAQAIWAGLWRGGDQSERRAAGRRWLDLAARTGTISDVAVDLEEKLAAGHASADDLALLIDVYVGVDDPISAAQILQSFKSVAGNEAEQLRQLANLYLRCERFALAAKTLEKLIDAEPAKAVDTLQELAVIALERNRPDEAERAMAEIAKRTGATPTEAEMRGGIFDRLDRPLDAAREYRKAVAADPTQHENWLLWAAAMSKAGQKPLATRRLQLLVDEAKDDDAFVTAVDGLLNVDAPAAALRVARRRVIERIVASPRRLMLYELLGDVCDALGDTAMGNRVLAATLPLAGEQRSEKVRQLFQSAESAGDVERAADYGRQLIALGDVFPAQLFLDLGGRLLDAGRPEEAERAFGRAVEADDSDATRRRIAGAYKAAGYTQLAARTLNRIAARQPFDVSTLIEMAQLNEQTGAFGPASRAYADALGLTLRRVSGEAATGAATKPIAKATQGIPGARLLSETDQLLEPMVAGAIATSRTPEQREALLTILQGLCRAELDRLRAAKAARPSDAFGQAAAVLRRVAFAVGTPDAADAIDREALAVWPTDGGLRMIAVSSRVDAGLFTRAHAFVGNGPLPTALQRFADRRGPTTVPSSPALADAAALLPQWLARGQTDAARTLLAGVTKQPGPDVNSAVPVILAAAKALGDEGAADAWAAWWLGATLDEKKPNAFAINNVLRAAWPVLSPAGRTAALSRLRSAADREGGGAIALMLLRAGAASIGGNDATVLAKRAAAEPFLMGRTLAEILSLAPAAARPALIEQAMKATQPNRRRGLLLEVATVMDAPLDDATVAAFAAALRAQPPVTVAAGFGFGLALGGPTWCDNTDQPALLRELAAVVFDQAKDDVTLRFESGVAWVNARDARGEPLLIETAGALYGRPPPPRGKDLPAYIPRPQLSRLTSAVIALSPAAQADLLRSTRARCKAIDARATPYERSWRSLVDGLILRTLGERQASIDVLTEAFRRAPQDADVRRTLLRWLTADGRDADVADLLTPFINDPSVVDSEHRSTLERALTTLQRFDTARRLVAPTDDLAKRVQRMRLMLQRGDRAAFMQSARATVIDNRTRLRAIVPILRTDDEPDTGPGVAIGLGFNGPTGAGRSTMYGVMADDATAADDLATLLHDSAVRGLDFQSLLDAVIRTADSADVRQRLVDDLEARATRGATTVADRRLALALATRPDVRLSPAVLAECWDVTLSDDSIAAYVALDTALTAQHADGVGPLTQWVKIACPVLAETLPVWAGRVEPPDPGDRPGVTLTDAQLAALLTRLIDAGHFDEADAAMDKATAASQASPDTFPQAFMAWARSAAAAGDGATFSRRLATALEPAIRDGRAIDVRAALPEATSVHGTDAAGRAIDVITTAAGKYPESTVPCSAACALGAWAADGGANDVATRALDQAVILAGRLGPNRVKLAVADLALQLDRPDTATAIEIGLLESRCLPPGRAKRLLERIDLSGDTAMADRLRAAAAYLPKAVTTPNPKG